jgi:hypothetical protein
MALKRGIVAFYENKAADTKGRRLDEILEWPASELEHCHNYIQILFPLPERSAFNDPAPIIDKEVFEAFRSRKDLRDRLRESFQRILWFYGFQLLKDNDGKLEVSNRSSISKSELDGSSQPRFGPGPHSLRTPATGIQPSTTTTSG